MPKSPEKWFDDVKFNEDPEDGTIVDINYGDFDTDPDNIHPIAEPDATIRLIQPLKRGKLTMQVYDADGDLIEEERVLRRTPEGAIINAVKAKTQALLEAGANLPKGEKCLTEDRIKEISAQFACDFECLLRYIGDLDELGCEELVSVETQRSLVK